MGLRIVVIETNFRATKGQHSMGETATLLDYRGDWAALPTAAMRKAMADAELGNDMNGEDPTVNRLEERVAEMLGKEAAMFVASGTMGNLIGIMSLAPWGSEILVGDQSHIFVAEQGGASALAGHPFKPMQNDRFGAIDPDDIARSISPEDQHYARTGLLCLENTHNVRGGIAIPVGTIQTMAGIARDAGIPVHLDGSRLWHASVALDTPLDVLAGPCDTVQVCLSKGLAAPVGSMLAGPRDVIKEARRHRKILGGAMRQAGVLAAAGLVALDEIFPRLDEDHRNARRLAEGLAEMPGVSVDLETVQTNLVYAKLPAKLPGHQLEAQLKSEGILIGAYNPTRVRFALHYQIDRAGVDRTLAAVKRLVAQAA